MNLLAVTRHRAQHISGLESTFHSKLPNWNVIRFCFSPRILTVNQRLLERLSMLWICTNNMWRPRQHHQKSAAILLVNRLLRLKILHLCSPFSSDVESMRQSYAKDVKWAWAMSRPEKLMSKELQSIASLVPCVIAQLCKRTKKRRTTSLIRKSKNF